MTLLRGDCLELMPTLESGSVDLILADPPYPEIDRDYGRMSEADWHDMMRKVVSESRRLLKPSGSAVFILQPNSEKLGRLRPWLWEFMAWTARQWNQVQDVWWLNTTPIPCAPSTREVGLLRPSVKVCVWLGEPDCYRNQEAVLWTISQNFKVSDIATRVIYPSGHSANRQKITQTAFNRGGSTPYNIIPIPNANSNSSGGALGHGAATPIELCKWWIRYLTKPGDLVCDPFMGSGTTGAAAVEMGRSFVGIEKEPRYFEMAKKWIEDAEANYQHCLDFEEVPT